MPHHTNAITRLVGLPRLALALAVLATAAACDSNGPTSPTSTTATTTTETAATTPTGGSTTTAAGGSTSIASVVSSRYKNAVTVAVGATSVVLRSRGVPDHVTPYWGTGHAMHEAQLTGQSLTPGVIGEQTFVMTIPLSPTEAATKEATSLGPIGMALNGVAIYNDREGGNVPVDSNTLRTFDRAGAHVGPGAVYHYHFDGDFTSYDDAALIGFLRDGFPIYGRRDAGGSYPFNLDSNGGHVGATADFATPIYHYHASRTAYMNSRFYILKEGSYHGTKGTFSS
jgi:hypothetical protein